jgi:small subunit ribosomal protein S9
MAKPAPIAVPVAEEPQPAAPTFVDTVKLEEDDLDLGPVVIEEAPAEGTPEKYFESVGRRKRAIARVRLYTRKSGDPARDDRALMTVNGKDYLDYFTDAFLQERVEGPLKRLKSLGRFKVTVLVLGGGLSGQADAVRHGISRTLELFDANFRKKLKKAGFLTRDPRRVQRKMPGLKKARKGPRWSKR